MIYTFVSDISVLDAEEAREALLGTPLYPHIDGGSPERAAAYLCLHRALCELFGWDACGELLRTERGRLAFADAASPTFSISHTEGLVAVAISTDGAPVGVDIERERPVRNEEKISERLLVSVNESVQRIESEILHLSLCPGACAKIAPREDFFTKWTLLEALLKADGGGFASVCSVARIIPSSTAESFLINYKEERYYLSVAQIKKNA